MSQIPELLDEFQESVPGFIATDLVDLNAGMSVGGLSADPNFDGEMASASYSEVIKSNRRALELLGMDPHSTEDILITTEPVYILMRELSPNYFQGMAISTDSNLGMARMIMKKYAPKFRDALEG